MTLPTGPLDVNIEVGESYGRWRGGDDEASLAHATSASVACGYHAGDHNAMARMVEVAAACGVAVGAHPGYPDRLGFGYRPFEMADAELRALVLYQVGALDALLRAGGGRLHHVKPHGALYMQALVDARVARAVVEAVASLDDRLVLYVTAGTAFEAAAAQAGLRCVREFFADRPLSPAGELLADWADWFEPTPANAAARAVEFLRTGTAAATDGSVLDIDAECVCLHTDNPEGAAVVAAVAGALRGAGAELRAPSPPG